ncbi:hypothetical protein ACQUW5_07305 [Legionella sp. CNM-1927-20]|uniref:hypothetical protein n=1 Tax=Legionella sp. CNM-1927-20 TaxID=3422221 RepID=UPI00403B3038
MTLLGIILIEYELKWINSVEQQYINIPQNYWYLQLATFLILILFIIVVNTLASALFVYKASFNLLGKDVLFRKALYQCWVQWKALLSWGIFFTCAGFILSLLQVGKSSKLIFSTAKASWDICVFLTMPYIILENLTPSEAFTKASQQFAKTAIFRAKIFMLLGLYLAPLILPVYFASYVMPQSYDEIFKRILYYEVAVLGLIWLIWGNAFNSVLKTALYLNINNQDNLFLHKEDMRKIAQFAKD